MVTAAMKLKIKQTNKQTKKHLILGRKTMTILDSILKSRDITLPTKVHLVKAVTPRSQCLNFVAAVTVHNDCGAQENET